MFMIATHPTRTSPGPDEGLGHSLLRLGTRILGYQDRAAHGCRRYGAAQETTE